MSDPRTFYEKNYHFQEDVEKPDFYRLKHALSYAEPNNVQRFLDLGCGTGWLSAFVLRHYQPEHVVGLDFSRTALRLAKFAHPREIFWIQADGCSLPFDHETFDYVFSFGSFEHFPDLRTALQEVHRILRKSGIFTIVVPNFYVKTEQPQEHRATMGNWIRLLSSNGFEVIRTGKDRGPMILKNKKPHRILLRIMIRILNHIPGLHYQHILVSRKK